MQKSPDRVPLGIQEEGKFLTHGGVSPCKRLRAKRGGRGLSCHGLRGVGVREGFIGERVGGEEKTSEGRVADRICTPGERRALVTCSNKTLPAARLKVASGRGKRRRRKKGLRIRKTVPGERAGHRRRPARWVNGRTDNEPSGKYMVKRGGS